MIDIVEMLRLLHTFDWMSQPATTKEICFAAAYEIERLREYYYANIDLMEAAADRIEQLEAALQKYADEEYNGYNACGKHARAALAGEKTND